MPSSWLRLQSLERRILRFPNLEKLLKFAEVKAENTKLRQIIKENTKRDTENAELKTEIAKLRHDIEEMKQQIQVITEVQNACSIENIFLMKVILKISAVSIPSD